VTAGPSALGAGLAQTRFAVRRAGAFLVARAVVAFLVGDFLAARTVAVALRAGALRAVARLAAVFFPVAFLAVRLAVAVALRAGDFFAVAFLVAVFFAGDFLAAAVFLAAVFLAGDFFAVAFLAVRLAVAVALRAGDFFAAVRLAAVFFAVVFFAVRLAAAFLPVAALVVFLAVRLAVPTGRVTAFFAPDFTALLDLFEVALVAGTFASLKGFRPAARRSFLVARMTSPDILFCDLCNFGASRKPFPRLTFCASKRRFNTRCASVVAMCAQIPYQ
jgi:hypothetical protein